MSNQQPVKLGEHEKALALGQDAAQPIDGQPPVPVGKGTNIVMPPDMEDPNNPETYYAGEADRNVKPNPKAAVKTGESPHGSSDSAKPETNVGKQEKTAAKQTAKAHRTTQHVKRGKR